MAKLSLVAVAALLCSFALASAFKKSYTREDASVLFDKQFQERSVQLGNAKDSRRNVERESKLHEHGENTTGILRIHRIKPWRTTTTKASTTTRKSSTTTTRSNTTKTTTKSTTTTTTANPSSSTASSSTASSSSITSTKTTTKATTTTTTTPACSKNKCTKCLSYYGNYVMSNITIVPVFWSSSVNYRSQLTSLYCDIMKPSPWLKVLSQYGASTGQCAPSVTASGLATGTVSDATIQSTLASLISANKVPYPTRMTYYAIHFPPEVSAITMGGTTSCQSGGFCAYHGTFKYQNLDVMYGVMPDLSTGMCSTGCGSNSQLVNNLVSVSSHELAETITDPLVGYNSYSYLSWYNNNYGEISDICNGQQTTITIGAKTYVVQKNWSNCKLACA